MSSCILLVMHFHCCCPPVVPHATQPKNPSNGQEHNSIYLKHQIQTLFWGSTSVSVYAGEGPWRTKLMFLLNLISTVNRICFLTLRLIKCLFDGWVCFYVGKLTSFPNQKKFPTAGLFSPVFWKKTKHHFSNHRTASASDGLDMSVGTSNGSVVALWKSLKSTLYPPFED